MEALQIKRPRFSVLGAGNGGQAMAADLTLRGFEVCLYNRTPERLAPLARKRVIELEAVHARKNVPSGRAKLSCVTSDIRTCVEFGEILMIVVPANAHAWIAEQCAPHLRDNQLIVLHPGRTGGALEILDVLKRCGTSADVTVAEAQTLLYACRVVEGARVLLYSIKNSVPVAAVPAYRTPDVIKRLSAAFSEFVPGDNVMKTSLENIGAIFHPAVTVLNTGRIESTSGKFDFYIDGVSPSVATLLEDLDAERVAVGAALGYRLLSAREWLYLAYGAAGKTLIDAIRANEGYYGIQAPAQLDHRYLSEDIPMSLVPIASLGEMLDVPCPTIRSIVCIASCMHGVDYWATGRTVRTMGFEGLSVEDIQRLVLEGQGFAVRGGASKLRAVAGFFRFQSKVA